MGAQIQKTNQYKNQTSPSKPAQSTFNNRGNKNTSSSQTQQAQKQQSSRAQTPIQNIQNSAQKLKQGIKSQTNQFDQKIIGVPHIQNQYWRMVRSGKTKSLTKAFQEQLITCNQVIVPTSGHTIVHQSIILDKREYFKLCEVYGADWDKADDNGVTPLMKAVALNRTFYVQKLLELGADIDKKDNRGMTAKDYGNFYQSFDALDLLNED